MVTPLRMINSLIISRKTITDELLNNTWALDHTFCDGKLDRDFQLMDKIKLVQTKSHLEIN